MSRANQIAFAFLEDPRPSPVPRLARDAERRPLRPVVPQAARPRPPLAAVPVRREPAVPRDEELRQKLERRIAAELPAGRLALAVTDNRYTMISVKRDNGLYRLRLHRMFLEAESDIVRALGAYVGLNDREASSLLGRFIDLNQDLIARSRERRRAAPALRARGHHHDLQAIFDDLNARRFGGAIRADITWSAVGRGRKGRRSSIKMGSYSVEDRLIRIHPALDAADVPAYFIAWIVFHEMLHQKHEIPVVAGRRRFHTPAFLREEASFEHYAAARRWERENLDRLLAW